MMRSGLLPAWRGRWPRPNNSPLLTRCEKPAHMTDVLVIATDRTSLGSAESLIRTLADQGAAVCLVCTFDTRQLPDLGQSDARHLRLNPHLRSGNESNRLGGVASGIREQTVRLRLRRAPFDKRVAIAAGYTAWLTNATSQATAVIAADGASLRAARAVGRNHPSVWIGLYTDADVEDLVRRIKAQYVLKAAKVMEDMGSRPLSGYETPELLAAWSVLMRANSSATDHVVRRAAQFVGELLRLREVEAAEALATQALERSLTPAERSHLELQLIDARLSMLTPVGPEFETTLRKSLQYADQALSAGQLQTAGALLVSALRVAFHRELHADGLSSPLVDNPEDFTKRLRESAAFRALGTPIRDTQKPNVTRSNQRSCRVLIIPGAYASFAQSIIAGLSTRPDTEARVLDLKKDHPAFRNVSLHSPLLNDRLAQAVEHVALPISRDEREHLSWANTIFIDWCDNNAVWTIMHAPRSARIVVRIHSIDALSPHPHLIDWSKVSDVIFVGEHIRAMVTRAVPDLARQAVTHVVPNLLRLDKFDLPKSSTAGRTLAMVGWAQRVKDPLFALEVLTQLRSVDDTWRLMLVGRDFPSTLRGSEARYRDAYRRRAVADDVRDAVRYVGFTPRLADVFCDAGFVLSCSRRESQGVALIEGVASAAVPVVRNWPMFAAYDAARAAFPDDWVVNTPDQAVERILQHTDAQERESAGAAARSFVMERYDQSAVAERLFQILVE